MKNHTFSNGDQMPMFGLGTWKSAPGEVYQAIRTAIEIGYRHFDCAWRYENETEIGQALNDAFKAGDVKREELWITSKLWNNAHQKNRVSEGLKDTLKQLQLEYLDLYLIHWPVAIKPEFTFPSDASGFMSLEEVPLLETWQGMEAMMEKGWTKHIGVSNFSIEKLKRLSANATHPIEANQIELHPFLQQPALIEYCQSNQIFVTAYSPLGSSDRPDRLKLDGEPVPLKHPVILSIAEKHNSSAGQVLIAWALARGTSVIPKSSNPNRLKENFEAQQLVLEPSDMETISKMDKHYRFIHGKFWCPAGSPYTLESLWNE